VPIACRSGSIGLEGCDPGCPPLPSLGSRLTQASLARNVGCAEVTIQKIEADERKPSAQIAALLAEQLQLLGMFQSHFTPSSRSKSPHAAARISSGVPGQQLPAKAGSLRLNPNAEAVDWTP
jgi:DNA-binding XRE family transcriptional regulator